MRELRDEDYKAANVKGIVKKDCFCAVCLDIKVHCPLPKVQALSSKADLAEIINGTVLSSEADLRESGVFR